MTANTTTMTSMLDALAMWVAERLDAGDDESAWVTTRAVERLGGDDRPDERRPANPIIGHRFAAAHRRLLDSGAASRPLLEQILGHDDVLDPHISA